MVVVPVRAAFGRRGHLRHSPRRSIPGRGKVVSVGGTVLQRVGLQSGISCYHRPFRAKIWIAVFGDWLDPAKEKAGNSASLGGRVKSGAHWYMHGR